MSENDSNDDIGYVTDNTAIATRGLLILYSVTGGRVSYESFANTARALSLPQTYVPDIRRLQDSFAIAKNNLDGMALPTLEAADGWDGSVQRQVKVVRLQRSNEYVVQVESRGRARGKNHVESENVYRLEFTPPEDFDIVEWREEYMAAIWDAESETEPDMTVMRQCLSVTPYWEDSEIDPMLMARIAQALMQEYEIVATSIDQKMLRDRIVRVLSSELGALPFRSGQGAYFLARPQDEEASNQQLQTLERYSALLNAFGTANMLSGNAGENNWFDENGRPRDWHRPGTNLRIMGYIDNERQMGYIRSDIQTNIGREIAEYQQKLMEVAQSFNEDKIDAFNKRLDSITSARTVLSERLSHLTAAFGEVEMRTELYQDVAAGINEACNRISAVNSSVAGRLLGLTTIE